MLCGKSLCPVALKFESLVKTGALVLDTRLAGISPPAVFVGGFGSPKVFVGPMVPPILEDTSLLSKPELWFGKSIQEVVEMRSKLVRGKYLVSVDSPSRGLDRISEKVQELGISSAPAESEVEFVKKPTSTVTLSDHFEPFGPSATLKEFDLGNCKVSKHVERAFYDTDLKAEGAVMLSYRAGVEVSAIQRAFSVGAFGLGKRRRFVPTRWSITAVDSIISQKLIQGVKENPLVNDYLVYECDNLDNRYLVLMIPEPWCYEWIEAWWPGTAWNPEDSISVEGDHEFFEGRTTYASIGGCYYAVRLAVAEKLSSMGRQAGVVALREAYPGYIVPVGVWINRESVRAALRKEPKKFGTLSEALQHISTRMRVPISSWVSTSALLKDALYQKRLRTFFSEFGLP
ncbi:MAG: hypothetical protein JTT11_10000 [Candidatus Brockarchaeota archaeon]|nr:hypothetical protein [Candidatus Brockarchaeota archaeon]